MFEVGVSLCDPISGIPKKDAAISKTAVFVGFWRKRHVVTAYCHIGQRSGDVLVTRFRVVLFDTAKGTHATHEMRCSTLDESRVDRLLSHHAGAPSSVAA